MPTHLDPLYTLITLATMALSWFASHMLQRRFREFSELPLPVSGREVAEHMLSDFGLSYVNVVSTPGQLTDHYNPANKTVNLSEVVFHANNVAAAAVAAHECGHAVQHKVSYPFLKFRSFLVPVVNLSNQVLQWVLMIGLMLAATGKPTVLLIGVILFGLTTLFAIITLPVEFNASARALKWLESSGITQGAYHDKARSALFWAAMTYTIGALASIGQLLYFIMKYMQAQGRNDDR